MATSVRIGYVPEHFSTPLHFAVKYFSLNASLIPFPSGTGHMISSLQAQEIDIALGLTEGFVSALGNQGNGAGFKLVGTYVETPLCWAISTGVGRDLDQVQQLKEKKCGVSRIGSGSHVMGFVLAESFSWLKHSGEPPFPVVPLQTFAKLREAVNDGTADFFMWEHFTSKRYYDKGEIKKIGEIYTPWSSWKIVARDDKEVGARLPEVFKKLNQGVEYFLCHQEEAVTHISSELDYSREDAREWLKTVRFSADVKGVREETIKNTIRVLRKAGVIGHDKDTEAESMIGIFRGGESFQDGLRGNKSGTVST